MENMTVAEGNVDVKEDSKKKNKGIRRELIAVVTVGSILLVVIIVIIVHEVSKSKSSSKTNNDTFVVVNTSCNRIKGKVHEVTTDAGVEISVYEFRNIPYALPPTGKLRWRPPVPVPKSSCDQTKTFKYNEEIVKCKQPDKKSFIGREDCLILTVRSPIHPDNVTQKNKLPVLFWIHGGGLFVGSSYWKGYYPDEEFSASMNLVTVSINYRLGIFGFLSVKELWVKSGSGKSYGNYGIMDMIEALRWVQAHIKTFGGDPDKVVIFGESGGGKAVFDLISSPKAKGLFHKAIPSSGYPMSRVETHHYANQKFRVFLNDTECHGGDGQEVLDCLQNLDANDILKNSPWNKYPDPNAFYWTFPFNKPNKGFPVDVIDNYIIPKPLGDITAIPNTEIDILIGNMAQEGKIDPAANTWEGMKTLLKPRIDSFQTGIYNTIINMSREKRDDKVSPVNISSQYVYTVLSSDVLLSCQTNNIAKNLSAISNVAVYRYVVSQTLTNSNDGTMPTAFHGIDTAALFGYKNPAYTPNPTVDDNKLMMNLRMVFNKFIRSELNSTYGGKTIDFWDNKIIIFDNAYHAQECQLLKENGFLKKSWGQVGI